VENFHNYLDMGGYAAYIWPSWLITMGALAGLGIWIWTGLRRRHKLLKQLQDTLDSDCL